MDAKQFEALKQAMVDGLHEYQACKVGFRQVKAADSFQDLCAALDKYWPDVVSTFHVPFHAWMEKFYPLHKEEFNRFGIHFNECAFYGKVILTEGAHEIYGAAKAWVYNKAHVTLDGLASCIARDQAFVCAQGMSSVQLYDHSSCFAYDRSVVSAHEESEVCTFDHCTVYAGQQSKVYCTGWNHITAVGMAEVTAPRHYKINLYGQAKLTIK